MSAGCVAGRGPSMGLNCGVKWKTVCMCVCVTAGGVCGVGGRTGAWLG